MEEKAVKIVVTEGCEACENIKNKNLDVVELIDIMDPRALELVGKTEGDITVPQAFDEKGQSCKISISDNSVIVDCKEKRVVLLKDSSLVLDENDQEITSTEQKQDEI